MNQSDLFPKATRIVNELEAYAKEIEGEIGRLHDQISKKKVDADALYKRLASVNGAVHDAQAFAATLLPEVKDPIVEVIKEPEAFDEPEEPEVEEPENEDF